jgi:phospholipid-binding lipoprotein MlaA
MNTVILKKISIYVLLFSIMSGCASVRNNFEQDPRDPWEKTNRVIFNFNESVDRNLFKPISQNYEKIIPPIVRTGVSNFFTNLGDFLTAIQHFLQLDFKSSGESATRFVINSTVGVLGINDVASKMGISKTVEDTGQTLGTFGVNQGPYVVLPFFGPSSVRDGIGKVVDFTVDPFNKIVTDKQMKATGNLLRVVDTRSQFLSAEQAFEALAFDKYVGVRNAYLAIRKSQVEE